VLVLFQVADWKKDVRVAHFYFVSMCRDLRWVYRSVHLKKLYSNFDSPTANKLLRQSTKKNMAFLEPYYSDFSCFFDRLAIVCADIGRFDHWLPKYFDLDKLVLTSLNVFRSLSASHPSMILMTI